MEKQVRIESLISYSHDKRLGRNLKGLFLIKSFNQRLMWQSALERIKAGGPLRNVIGGVKGRDCHEGLAFIASFDTSQLNLLQAEWKYKTKEATGVSSHGSKLSLASGNVLEVIDNSARTRTLYNYPWFGHMHTVSYSSDGKKVLLASSGFDVIFELDLEDAQITWEWNSWEHGYAHSQLGHYLTRRRDVAEKWTAQGKSVLFVDDPKKYSPFGVPTGLRACHLNGAEYYEDNIILSTFFHKGLAIRIDKTTDESVEVVQGMKSVHGFLPDNNYGSIITDTNNGKLFILNKQFATERVITFSEMPLSDPHLPYGEWLQYVTNIWNSIYAAIDIRRSCLFLVDTEKRSFRQINIDPNWALQMVVPIPKGFEFKDVAGYAQVKRDVTD